VVFLILDLAKLKTNSEVCNILVLECLGLVESNKIIIVTLGPITKLRFGHNPIANNSLESFLFFFFSLHLALCDWFFCFMIFYNGKQSLENGARVHNRPPTSWALNVPCPPTHHISSNLIVPIAHLFIMCHHKPILHLIPHVNHKLMDSLKCSNFVFISHMVTFLPKLHMSLECLAF
jgi:hypothetical protein